MTKVTIRQKPISQCRHTLYLDYYPPIPNPDTGKLTRREFLKLYVYDKPKNPLDKQHNKDTYALAENIKAKRQLDVQNQQYGFMSATQRSTTLLDYYREQASKRTGSNASNWTSSQHYLEQFFNEGLKLSELTAAACNDYKDYLLTAPSQRLKDKSISRNTALSYFNNFKAVLKEAYKADLLKTDLNAKVKTIKAGETHREYLTLEELQALYKIDCPTPILKQAAIFSALTGLRFSDIVKLSWQEIQHSNAQGYYLQFRQQKTQGTEVLPIPEQAVQILGERGQPTDKVFKNLHYLNYYSKVLKAWIEAAGITKHITFHCFRHTYATLQLSLGTDIYVVSKMLGHREVKTTQVYAKVVDKAKQEAAGKIKLNLGI